MYFWHKIYWLGLVPLIPARDAAQLVGSGLGERGAHDCARTAFALQSTIVVAAMLDCGIVGGYGMDIN
jgi:hypothetical protein